MTFKTFTGAKGWAREYVPEGTTYEIQPDNNCC